SRKIIADFIPAISIFSQLENMIAPEIDGSRCVAGNDERTVPIESIARMTFLGRRLQQLAIARAQISATQESALALGVHDIGIRRIKRDVKTITIAHELPIGIGDAGALVIGPIAFGLPDRSAGPEPRTVVLQAAGDSVWIGHVERNVVELA